MLRRLQHRTGQTSNVTTSPSTEITDAVILSPDIAHPAGFLITLHVNIKRGSPLWKPWRSWSLARPK